eukprot:8176088-Pyramimonas_sp.AAC.1
MCMGVAPLRLLTGAISSCARFHAPAAGCVFGSHRLEDGSDRDSIRHYSIYPRLENLLRELLGPQ